MAPPMSAYPPLSLDSAHLPKGKRCLIKTENCSKKVKKLLGMSREPFCLRNVSPLISPDINSDLIFQMA